MADTSKAKTRKYAIWEMASTCCVERSNGSRSRRSADLDRLRRTIATNQLPLHHSGLCHSLSPPAFSGSPSLSHACRHPSAPVLPNSIPSPTPLLSASPSLLLPYTRSTAPLHILCASEAQWLSSCLRHCQSLAPARREPVLSPGKVSE